MTPSDPAPQPSKLNIKSFGIAPNEQGTLKTCPRCKGEFYKDFERYCFDCEAEAENDEKRAQGLRRQIDELFGGEWATQQLSFDSFIDVKGTEKALRACRDFNPKTDNLYLWGDVGRGKTHLAVATAYLQFVAGSTIGFYSTRELVNSFRLKEPEEEAAQTRRLAALSVLVIDDLGISALSDFGTDILCTLLNKRTWANRNGLIVTSNLFLDSLAEKQGHHRLSSRLGGMCKVLEVRGQFDMRLKKKQ